MSADETPAARGGRRFDTTVKPRRRPMLIAAGIAIVIVGALLITQLIRSAQTEHRVLEVHADVARGEVIRDTDLVSVTVGQVDNVSTVPADQLDSLSANAPRQIFEPDHSYLLGLSARPMSFQLRASRWSG